MCNMYIGHAVFNTAIFSQKKKKKAFTKVIGNNVYSCMCP